MLYVSQWFYRYNITEDNINKKYLFDLKFAMCYEADACDETFTIFSSTEFNMETCSYKYDFLDPGEFSSETFFEMVSSLTSNNLCFKVVVFNTASFTLISPRTPNLEL